MMKRSSQSRTKAAAISSVSPVSVAERIRVSKDKATVIVTVDKKKDLNMAFCGYERLTKVEISENLCTPLPKGSVLCSNGHTSYKGYAMDNHIEHVAIRADLGQHVKRGDYHMQHVASLHSRLKKWLNGTFWGVATSTCRIT